MKAQVKDLFDFFAKRDRETRRTAYAVLVVRTAVKNPMTADNLSAFVFRHDGTWAADFSFNDMEAMMEWLGMALTFGFDEDANENEVIENLWQEIVKQDELRSEGLSRSRHGWEE